MSSIAALRVSIFLVLTLALLPTYLFGLLLDHLFGQRIVLLQTKKLWSRAVLRIVGIEKEIKGSKSKSNIFSDRTYTGCFF